ncbi:MAG: redox-sensing transcriptional repressor Rex [Thermoleophilia bacterium]
MGYDISRRVVPAVAVPRLTLYLRKLQELEAQGVTRVSSRDLADLVGFNAAQIRKDLSYLGEFGTRGVGYEVARLVEEIDHCLGLDREWHVVIVGAGLLGTALARYRGFAQQGFRLVGIFDVSDVVVGTGQGDGTVRSIDELEALCRRQRVDIALVTVPASAAEATIARLGAAGVRAILNFAPIKVLSPKGVIVRQVDLSSELMSLTYYLQGEA